MSDECSTGKGAPNPSSQPTVENHSSWYVYIVRCNDGSMYTGMTNDLVKRIQTHNSGKAAAKYTKSRRPVSLVYFEELPTRSSAASREFQIKKLTTIAKRKLVQSFGGDSGKDVCVVTPRTVQP